MVGYYPGDAFHGHKHEEKIEAGDWLYVPLDDAGLRLTFDGVSFSARPGYANFYSSHNLFEVWGSGERGGYQVLGIRY